MLGHARAFEVKLHQKPRSSLASDFKNETVRPLKALYVISYPYSLWVPFGLCSTFKDPYEHPSASQGFVSGRTAYFAWRVTGAWQIRGL